MVVEVAWGGFTMERSVHEILWGYDDPFVKKLHDQPVLQGGDPSSTYEININVKN